MFNLLSSAHASAPTGASGVESTLMSIAPFIAVFVIMYFMIIRPQNKRAKETKMMLDSIKKGDRVITAGGIIGVISKVDDQEVTVEVADNVEMRVIKSSISQVISKLPSKDKSDEDSPVRKAINAKQKSKK